MMKMHYVSLPEMMAMIRRNIYKVPHDIDFVIGVPRSGMIPASVIAEFINVPLIDVDSFISGARPTGGNRLNFVHRTPKEKPKVLVIDDTIFSGTAMRITRGKLHNLKDKYNFIFAAAYKESPNPKESIDLFLDDVSKYTANGIQVTYEWNLFHHYPHIMDNCMYDLDGVFCIDPPDDRNEEQYLAYIKDATPLFCPTRPVYKICTYRIIKNKEITMKWLEEHGIHYRDLVMFNAQTTQERNTSGVGPAEFKAGYYLQDNNATLFVESDDWQAQRIYQLTGKQVFCTTTNKLYGEIKL